jgi:hypothetical protein
MVFTALHNLRVGLIFAQMVATKPHREAHHTSETKQLRIRATNPVEHIMNS